MADPSKYPTRLAPYGLRIPPDLKARLEASAKASGRTLHAEIITALEFLYPAPTPADDLRDQIDQVIEAWTEADSPDDLRDHIGTLINIRERLLDAIEETAERKARAREAPEGSDDDLPF